MTPEQARAVYRSRKPKRLAASTAAVQAKADARARKILDMAEQGLSHEEMAEALGIQPSSVFGAIRAAKIRLGEPR